VDPAALTMTTFRYDARRESWYTESASPVPAQPDEILRDLIAEHLGRLTWEGQQLTETHTQALAIHLLSFGGTEGFWAGSRSEPRSVHVFTLKVDEILAR
jgi:hypothetical protein